MMKRIIFTLSLIICLSGFSQNYLTYTPQTLNVSGNSNEEILASIRVNCYGGETGSCSGSATDYISIPDNGLLSIGYTNPILFVGDVTDMVFRFKRNVNFTTISTYTFKAVYFDNRGGYHEKPITINVTYNYATCNLNAPSSSNTNDITENSAKLNWSSVANNSGYQYQYKKSSFSSWTTGTTSSTSKTITNLSANTDYQWRVRSKCSNGIYSDNWGSIKNFTTSSASCTENVTIDEDIYQNQGTVSVEVSNTIIATNIINTSYPVTFKAENKVILNPGFHVQSGTNFRAFIEDCTAGRPSLAKSSNSQEELTTNSEDLNILKSNEIVSVYPNPTKENIFIKSEESINHWNFTTLFNEVLFEGKENLQTINTQNLPKGIYVLRVFLNNGELITKKVIKE
ncbi:putative secreted protein (Por secretion system target) [Tenacibaculum adriaticum]|uniref:Putative secreted protein (Por secretion system target) n=1 Tax=Tenacibaculum adriaticum TaxID=413713 RepID=A0A5S5DVL2_9FLAO|nr:3-coathanger stack domain-containing protein [Tenacibaculum adriaticum]TYP99891.1 putative secreted protein (Por secretion system target) [Tenacibaculum adriaticum]